MILKNFIVFEGLDGSGTTTQSRLLSEKLNVVFTCEPSDNPVGSFIRQILRKEHSVLPQTLAGLFTADRHEHLSVRMALNSRLKMAKQSSATATCFRRLHIRVSAVTSMRFIGLTKIFRCRRSYSSLIHRLKNV